MPSISMLSASRVTSAWAVRFDLPVRRVISAKAQLQEWARASFRVCSPWALGQVIRSPLTILTPSQTKVSSARLGSLSRAAARVVSLKMEPGV